jgi:pimeloyl-ACP methyl ester carboxylesterase
MLAARGIIPTLAWLVCLCGLWAGSCLSAGLTPSIEDTLEIDMWQSLGPFSAGPRENALSIAGRPQDLHPDSLKRYPSTLVQGGYVGWKPAPIDSTGWVSVRFEDVLWDTLIDVYGYAGIVNEAFAYGEFTLAEPRRALIQAEAVGSFWINGRLLPGDPYGHGFMRVPVILTEGTNRITVGLSGYGDHTFRLVLLPVRGPVMTLDDYTVPDIVRGAPERVWVGITVLNTTDAWLEDVLIAAGGNAFTAPTQRMVCSVAPLCIVKAPMEVDITALPDSGDTLDVPIGVWAAGSTYRDTLHLRIRNPDQSVKRTFISGIDGSCQYYAVLPPADFQEGKTYALILTLHGANVKAENQVDAYHPKAWAYVVAPTNRRPYGFDWQDWGELDALEVLDIAKSTLPVDTNRVYLAGHSMGGHGTWHIGLSHPDLFAAMAPAAGWSCFELYIPWFLQKAYIFGDPAERVVRETALRQDWPHTFVENACNLPIFILQGGADDNVPPFHSRLFAGRLEELGYEYRYKEDPGRGHWYRIDSLDVACVDDPDLMGFLEGRMRNAYPRDVVFKTVNPSHSRRAYWLELTEQDRLYHESSIEAHVSADTVRIETRNVKSFALMLSRDLVPSGRAVLEIEGRRRFLGFADARTLRFSRRAGEFRLSGNTATGMRKNPNLYGPIKQAMFSPFVLVYGTIGSADVTDLLLHLARLEAFQWWRRGNGFVEILPDSAVTRTAMEGRNLVLFGGPRENSIVERIERLLPIQVTAGGVALGTTFIRGTGLGVRFVYPNPLSPDKLVLINEGTDCEGLELLPYMRGTFAGAGLPDFVIFGDDVRRMGWGGITAGGFFDSDWHVDPDLLECRCRQEY